MLYRHDFKHFDKYVENDDELSIKPFKKFDTFNQFLSQKFVLRKTNKIKKDSLTYSLINNQTSSQTSS